MLNRWLVMCGAFVMGSCNGVIGDAVGEGGSSEPRCGRSVCGATGELAAGTAFPRLTHAQWENSVRDVLRLQAVPDLSDSFEPDTRISFFNNNARALRVSSDLWGDYQGAAESLAEAVTADGAALGRLLPTDLPSDATERVRALVRDLGRRTYRRALSNEE
jgi:hypothetical protein